jgi:hypothetical protein
MVEKSTFGATLLFTLVLVMMATGVVVRIHIVLTRYAKNLTWMNHILVFNPVCAHDCLHGCAVFHGDVPERVSRLNHVSDHRLVSPSATFHCLPVI